MKLLDKNEVLLQKGSHLIVCKRRSSEHTPQYMFLRLTTSGSVELLSCRSTNIGKEEGDIAIVENVISISHTP